MDATPLGPTDADEVVDLWHRTGLTRPWNDPHADFARAVAGPASAVLGLRDGSGALVGAAMVGEDGHRGWVYYLAVSPAAGRTGLGRQLMDACERWLAARGVPKIQFMVRSDNAAVLGFYEHLGYQRQDVAVLGRRLDEQQA